MQIGSYKLRSIETGEFALDGGAMFGVVPRTLWERVAPPDDRNRVQLALRALLLEEIDGPARILVDTGIGTKWAPKLADIYGVDHGKLSVERSLQDHGLTTGDITDVLLTHLHFDHAGGATTRRGDEVVPTYENARYWVQRRNLEWARNPTEKDRASYLAENFEPLVEHGVLELLEGPGPWRPGIELILSDGHTTAMQLPLVSGPEGALVYCADLIPTAAHMAVPWVMAYDNQPLVTIEEKKELLGRGLDGDWLFFFEHDIHGPAARVQHTNKGYSVGERVAL